MREILIGDVHGCSDSMEFLLDKVNFNDTSDRLIFLGDYMDRGKRSFEVFQKVIELKQTMGGNCVLLLGNHDWFFLNATEPEIYDVWKQNGFWSTRESFLLHDIELRFDNSKREQCISRLAKNSQLYYVGKGFQCAHAGIEKENISENAQEILIWDRNSAGVYEGALTVVGHTPLKAPTYYAGKGIIRELPYDKEMRLPTTGIINIDTGCVFGRKLTAMIIEGDSFKLVGVVNNE